VYGTPSGNYDGSSLDFDGTRQKASDYYISRIGTQSVLFSVDDFIGDVVIQGTLDADPVTTTNDADPDITASALRLNAGTAIADSVNHLETTLATLSPPALGAKKPSSSM
jgi:hypothetical protein